MTIRDVFERVRAEYLEMPDLRLNAEQVERLCGVERTVCEVVLGALVDVGFLSLKPDGHYVRATAGQIRRPNSEWLARAISLTNASQNPTFNEGLSDGK
jgi:hypothetical protein